MENNIDIYCPLDKSKIIRYCLMDYINGFSDHAIDFLNKHDLGDDLKRLKQFLENPDSDFINVGESATLWRFLRFITLKENKTCILYKEGTLKNRKLYEDKNIINKSLEELLNQKIDQGTSQWISAYMLYNHNKDYSNNYPLPFKSITTDNCIKIWYNTFNKKPRWELSDLKDNTIKKQMEFFHSIFWLGHDDNQWFPEQAEDYCIGRAFNKLSMKQGENLWSQLKNHESNRLEEMETMMEYFEKGFNRFRTKDHRIIMAIAMKIKLKEKNRNIFSIRQEIPFWDNTDKAFPQFWGWLQTFKCENIIDLSDI